MENVKIFIIYKVEKFVNDKKFKRCPNECCSGE